MRNIASSTYRRRVVVGIRHGLGLAARGTEKDLIGSAHASRGPPNIGISSFNIRKDLEAPTGLLLLTNRRLPVDVSWGGGRTPPARWEITNSIMVHVKSQAYLSQVIDAGNAASGFAT